MEEIKTTVNQNLDSLLAALTGLLAIFIILIIRSHKDKRYLWAHWFCFMAGAYVIIIINLCNKLFN